MNIMLDLKKMETFREYNRRGLASLVADQIVEKLKIGPTQAEDIVSRMAATSEADIKTLSIRVLTASNLEDLFDGIPEPK